MTIPDPLIPLYAVLIIAQCKLTFMMYCQLGHFSHDEHNRINPNRGESHD